MGFLILLKINTDMIKRLFNINKKKEFYLGLIEIYTWLFLGGILSFWLWEYKVNEDISIKMNRYILIFAFIIVPFTFKLIFSKYPIEYIRYKYLQKDEAPDIIIRAMSEAGYNLDVQMLLSHNIQESKINAERLFSQSRIYLLFGCLIAMAGVSIFFYARNNYIDNTIFLEMFNKGESLSILGLKIFEYLPRFGVLFFIEYIAFFFLKQYRILMEEYRYYEAIKRERQDILSAYLLFKDKCDDIEALKMLMNYLNEHSAKVPYITGSHKIKTEKMLNEDMDFISKLITLIQTIKTPDKTKE